MPSNWVAPRQSCLLFRMCAVRWGSEKNSEADDSSSAEGAAAGGASSNGAGDAGDAAGNNALVPNSAEHMHRKVRSLAVQFSGLIAVHEHDPVLTADSCAADAKQYLNHLELLLSDTASMNVTGCQQQACNPPI